MFEIHYSTVTSMLDIIDKFNNGKDIREDLSLLLDHDDYKIEIERYNEHEANIGFSKKEYIEFFISLRNIDRKTIKSKALKYRVDDLLLVMDNVDYYRTLLDRIKYINYEKAYEQAKYALAVNIDISTIHIIFSIGLGISGGWAYKNYTHYDLITVVDRKTPQGLLNVISHECHHIGHSMIENDKEISQASKLLYLLGVEGTAVKFCNNFEGLLTKKLNSNEEMSVNTISYNHYISNYSNIISQLKVDLNMLNQNLVSAKELFNKNYCYRDITVNGVKKENYLGQPINYFLGADLYGHIYDEFGIKEVIKCLENPELCLNYIYQLLDIK